MSPTQKSVTYVHPHPKFRILETPTALFSQPLGSQLLLAETVSVLMLCYICVLFLLFLSDQQLFDQFPRVNLSIEVTCVDSVSWLDPE